LLLGDPDVLVLDEVTNGLDPEGIAEVRTLIRQVAATGKTIILASHILDEVERVCSHVVVIRNGVKLAEGEVESMLKGKDQIVLASDNPGLLGRVLQDIPEIESCTQEGDVFLVVLKAGFTTAGLSRVVMDQGIALTRLEVRRNRLEDQFLELVKLDKSPKP
jgi:ABC-2 type transport system ATP-binding protein